MMKREILALKIVLFLMTVPVLIICLMWIPWTSNIARNIGSNLAFLQYLSFLFILIASFLYFFTLYHSLVLLNLINQKMYYTESCAKSYNRIKYSSLILSAQFAFALPFLFYIAQVDDAPGLAAIGLIITLASVVISLFASVLEKLVKDAVDGLAEQSSC